MQSGIHCKVSCNDQFRRFLFTGTEFRSLDGQVRNVFGLCDEFVLKYEDDEGDLITISSDEELSCAVGFTNGDLLRLTVSILVPVYVDSVPHPYGYPFRGGFGHCRGRRGSDYHRQQNGKYEQFSEERFRFSERKQMKLTQKRDFLKASLATLSGFQTDQREVNPNLLRRQSAMQWKLHHLECRLARFEERAKNGKKCGKKSCGKEEEKFPAQKEEKNIRSNNQGNIDAKQIEALKEQIRARRPALVEAKMNLRSKKGALKAARKNGEGEQVIDQLRTELVALKDVKIGLKNEIQPLRQKICELKMTIGK